jgi:membrane protease subunit HflC
VRLFIRALVTLVFLGALVAFAFTYTVRFTEAAVKTRFGQARGSDAVRREPGLYFRLPYPIDDVTRYDTRIRTLTLKLEQHQTSDNKQIVVEAFCNWRVTDPLEFYRRFSNAGERPEEHYAKAEESLSAAMRAAMGVVSQYSMEDLFTTGPGGSKLPELERRVKNTLTASEDASRLDVRAYGIEVVEVGIMRVALPEETSKAVYDRMKAARESIAKQIESRGAAEAQAIRAKAESDARKIREFAQALAADLKARGENESVGYLAQMKANEELAVFISQTDFLRTVAAKRTTLVLASDVPGIALLFPEAMRAAEKGQIPPLVAPRRIDGLPIVEQQRPGANIPAALEGGR